MLASLVSKILPRQAMREVCGDRLSSFSYLALMDGRELVSVIVLWFRVWFGRG